MNRLAPIGLCLLAGCALVPDSAADPARGAGTAAALLTTESARATAERILNEPAASCRSYRVPSSGPVRVVTEVLYVVKSPAAPSRRWWETREWVRDLDGDVSSSISLVHRMPDGRSTRRTREDRVVAGQSYAAIDGRFVDAARIGDLPARVERAPFEAVDNVLAYVAVDLDGRAVPAPSGGGLCDGPSLLPPPHSVGLRLGERSRDGWVRWQDEFSHVVVRFDESLRSVDRNVVAPDELWPVDPDDSYRSVQSFLEAGQEAGWLDPPRFDHEYEAP